MESAEDILRGDKYNIDHWNILLSKPKKHEDLCRDYDSFLTVFPTAARYWKTYIEKEIALGNYEHVEDLFRKCLFNCLDVDLWRSYITYIRKVKRGTPNEMRDINTAYEFVIKNVGMDVNSTVIWCDHIAFLKNELKGVSEDDRRKAIRGVYHLALVTPMSGVDQIWREYDSWEHINDKALAKGMLAGLYQQHQNAKSVCLNRKRLKRSILTGMLARPPYGDAIANERDYLQVIHWCKLLDNEKANPQKLTSLQLKERVIFTYKQALMYLRFYPEIWDSYAKYIFSRHTIDDAIKIYEQAVAILSNNISMHFRYAEFLEKQREIEKSRAVYDTFLERTNDPLVFVQLQRFARRSESKESARKVFVRAKKSRDCTHHIYLSSAFIEHFLNKEPKIALKILNLGLERFPQEPRFIIVYLDFLETQTDLNNMREIYERILAQMDTRRIEPIWDKFVDFEQRHCSELKVIENLLQRRTKSLSLPVTKVQINFLKQYGFFDLLPCPERYLKTLEKVCHAKVQDIPMETSNSTRRLIQQKNYTFKGVTKFFNPALDSMIEIKGGTRFLPSYAVRINGSGDEWPIPEISSVIEKLLKKLPHWDSVQGVPIRAEFIVRKIKMSPLPLKEAKTDKGKAKEVLAKPKKRVELSSSYIEGDLFSRRRKVTMM